MLNTAGGGDDDGEEEEEEGEEEEEEEEEGEEDGDFGEAETAAPGAATEKERWRGALDGRAL